MTIDAPSIFLSLPPELRLQIYREVVVYNETIQLPNSKYGKHALPFASTHTSLPAVCKLIRNEVEPMIWGENRFHIYIYNAELAPVIAWLERIGTDKANWIKHLCITFQPTRHVCRSIKLRLQNWDHQRYVIARCGGSSQMQREWRDEVTCQLPLFVDQVWRILELGLPRKSLQVENWQSKVVRNRFFIAAGISRACKLKIMQLLQRTYLHDEEEILVEGSDFGPWHVMLMFERHTIYGPIHQNDYRRQGPLQIERSATSLELRDGGGYRSRRVNFARTTFF